MDEATSWPPVQQTAESPVAPSASTAPETPVAETPTADVPPASPLPEENGNKKKWIKWGLVLVGILAVAATLYFGKSILFKGSITEIPGVADEDACLSQKGIWIDSDSDGIFKCYTQTTEDKGSELLSKALQVQETVTDSMADKEAGGVTTRNVDDMKGVGENTGAEDIKGAVQVLPREFSTIGGDTGGDTKCQPGEVYNKDGVCIKNPDDSGETPASGGVDSDSEGEVEIIVDGDINSDTKSCPSGKVYDKGGVCISNPCVEDGSWWDTSVFSCAQNEAAQPPSPSGSASAGSPAPSGSSADVAEIARLRGIIDGLSGQISNYSSQAARNAETDLQIQTLQQQLEAAIRSIRALGEQPPVTVQVALSNVPSVTSGGTSVGGSAPAQSAAPSTECPSGFTYDSGRIACVPAETATAQATGSTAIAAATTAVVGSNQPQTASAAAGGSAPTSRVAGTAGQGTRLHGSYIQGQTGPELLLYPILIGGANALFYLRKRRKNKK